MPQSLKNKVVKGVSWNLAERFGNQAMTFVVAIILARLLAPEDFGLIGMVTVFFAVAEVFIRSGFGEAYIQKKEVTDLDANTVFYTNMAISTVAYAVLWLAAPAIAAFYEQPQLIELTRVMGLVVIIGALNMIQVAQITRAVDFKRKTKVTLVATLTSGVGGVVAAIMGLGVWALVIRHMSQSILATLGFWFTSRWKPGLQFSRESFKAMFSFGSWVLASNVTRTIFDNIYILTIGKFFPAAQLGFYTKAKQFQRIPSQELAGAVGVVAFPVLSRFQNNKPEMRNIARKFLTHTLALIAPTLVILMVVAEPFVIILLTHKWAPMIPYLQLLCIVGVLYPIHLINVQILQAQGKSNLNFRLAVLRNGLRVLNIALMYRFGVIFIILGEVVVSVLSLGINTYYTKRLIDYGFIAQIKDIQKTLFTVAFSGIMGFAASQFFANMYAVFWTGLTVTALGYILLQFIFNRPFFKEIISLKENFAK